VKTLAYALACILPFVLAKVLTYLLANLQTYSDTYSYSYACSGKFFQQGHIRGKANTRGFGVWLWQSLTFGSSAAACGVFLCRLQKAILGSASNGVLQAVAMPHLWKLGSHL